MSWQDSLVRIAEHEVEELRKRLVVAHELAHVRHRDVPRGLLFIAIVAPPAAYAVAQLAGPRPSLPALLAAATAVSATCSYFLRFSKATERASRQPASSASTSAMPACATSQRMRQPCM
jgi:hypothetical protein